MLSVADRPGRTLYLSERDLRFARGHSTLVGSSTTAEDQAKQQTGTARGSGYRVVASEDDGTGNARPWLSAVLQEANDLLALPPGWDSYGAASIDPHRVRAGIDLLLLTMDDATPAPSLTPLSTGGLQFEWHEQGIDLEIEADAPEHFAVFYHDRTRDEEWDGTVSDDGGPLRQYLSDLARRRQEALSQAG